MTEPQHYKWMLRRGGQLVTAVQKNPWPVEVGEWTAEETPVLCESGWHAMEEKDVLSHLPDELGAELWVVETRGAIVTDDDKFAASQMRLVHHVGTTDARNLRLFACDVAEDVLHLFEAKYPNDDRPRRAIEVARRYAHGEATSEERAAAWDAAWAATRDAAGAARDAAGYAAGAARDAAGDAAWAAARDAARDAAGAAEYAARAAAGAARAAWAAREAARDAWAAAWATYSNWLVYRLWGGEDD